MSGRDYGWRLAECLDCAVLRCENECFGRKIVDLAFEGRPATLVLVNPDGSTLPVTQIQIDLPGLIEEVQS